MKVSVVIPLYNKADFVLRAIRSVKAQTLSALEIIVIDDGSTDGGGQLVENAFKDVKVITQKNQGVSHARNKGIAIAEGEYIAFLDADDYWYRDFLKVVKVLQNMYSDAHLFCTGYEFNEHSGKRAAKNPHLVESHGLIPDYFLSCCNADLPVTSSSVCVLKSSLTEVGGFPTDLQLGEDQAVWANIACRWKIAYSQEIQVVYDVTASTIGQSEVDYTQPSPHVYEFDKLIQSGTAPAHLIKSIRYLQHLTVMSSIKSNLFLGYKRRALNLLLSHPMLQWDHYRIIAFTLLILPKSLNKKIYNSVKSRR